MNDIKDIIFNEQWNKALEIISKDKNLTKQINPYDLAWKRFQYQLAENSIEELVPPFGNFNDLLKLIDICKREGLIGLNIPQATALQQLDQIKNFLNQGHKIDEQDFGERTGLLIASALNDIELVQFFINQGAFVSFYDQDNLEAIDMTTSYEIKDLLESHNGKTEKQRKEEFEEYCNAIEHFNNLRESDLSFIKSAQKGDLEQMKRILENSPIYTLTLNYAYPINGWTSLHYAAKNNDRKVFDFLISKGIDETMKNLDGLTAIKLAKQLGNKKIYENQ